MHAITAAVIFLFFAGRKQYSTERSRITHIQVGRSHKKYCAVAHSGRKQLAALELLYRELNIKSTVRMEKSLRKFEDDPAHTHKEYHHTGQQDRISGSAKTCRCQSLRCGLLIRFGSFSGFAGGFSGALSGGLLPHADSEYKRLICALLWPLLTAGHSRFHILE